MQLAAANMRGLPMSSALLYYIIIGLCTIIMGRSTKVKSRGLMFDLASGLAWPVIWSLALLYLIIVIGHWFGERIKPWIL